MHKTYDAVVAGHICLDISPIIASHKMHALDEWFTPGRLINLSGVTVSGGGVVANTGFALKKLGFSVLPVTSLGDDVFGRVLGGIIETQTGEKIVLNPKIRTSYSLIFAAKGFDRMIFHDPAGNNTFSTKDISLEVVGQAKLFHFGYPPLMRNMYVNGGEDLVRMYRSVYDLGVATSMDMSLPDVDSEAGQVDWLSMMAKTLPFVDFFLPSAEEALYILDRAEYQRVKEAAIGRDFTAMLDMKKICALGRRMLDMGCAAAGIKCGDKGLYLNTASDKRLERLESVLGINAHEWADREMFEEAYHVADLKSALAAGDTAIAGFLGAALRGESVFAAVKAACMAGALCCTRYDAISGLCGMDDLKEKIKKQPEKNHDEVLTADFWFDAEKKTWVK